MNPFKLLEQDHEVVAALFDRLHSSGSAERRRAYFDELERELDLHADIEEKLIYPELESRVPALSEHVRRAREDHRAVADILGELQALSPGDSAWPSRVADLRRKVERHIAEDEGTLFPKAETSLGVQRLKQLGREVQDMRQGVLERWKIEIKSAAENAVETAKRAFEAATGTEFRARDVMTIHPACCTPETNGEEIARLMIECDCGEIPVVQDWQSRKLIGVVTDRDIVCRLVAAGRNPLESRARDCMSSPVVFATAETDLDECCRLMEQHRIRRLPIVDAEGRCCAILSQADIALKAPQRPAARVLRTVSEPHRAAP